ncbi:MAG TPA: hypothetical protein VF432_29980 [Thermoanaerobaculia bacterium]
MKKLLILAVLLLALPLSAQIWNAAGSTGVIDEASLALYEFSGPSLQFKAGAVGTIVARYPVVSDVSNPGWGSFWLGYAGAGVTVRLKEVDQCGVNETVVTTFTNPNTPEANICIGHIFGPFTWNFAQRSYYIEVTLTRANTLTNPRFNRISFP